LGENLPAFLSKRGVRCPAIRVLFQILVGQNGLKRAAMQIEMQHVNRGKSL
jgi:hypothetical protein